MSRICVIDMVLTWPPDGGGAVDLVQVLNRLAQDHEVTLLIPRISRWSRFLKQPWPLSKTKFFLRGAYKFASGTQFNIETIDFTALELSPSKLTREVCERVEGMSPDHVFIADGWFYKPYLVKALAKYKPVLRLYAHEMMCIKGNGVLYKENKLCEVDYLNQEKSTYRECRKCSQSYLLKYPSPRWVFESIKAKAWHSKYQKICLEAFNLAQTVLVGNHFISSRLQKNVSSDVRAIPHGIDTKRFVPRAKKLPQKPFLFLLTGRLNMKIKGLDIALKAAEKLWLHRQDFQILVTSPQLEGKYPFIETLPWMPHDQVEQLYQKAHVLLMPSVWPDPFPIVVLEAMASGLPVIGSIIGGIPEQIKHYETGILFPPGNVEKLAKAMEALLDDNELYHRMHIQSRERAQKMFDIEAVYNAHYKDMFI